MTLTPAMTADAVLDTARTDAPRPVRRRPRQLRGAAAFLLHYLGARAGSFGTILLLTTCAAACAVGVQYAMKLLVDALNLPGGGAVRGALGLFLLLIVAETVLWRISGWIGCKATVAAGVDIRADLFEHLTGQPMRYFQEHLAGALGHRVTAMAGHFGALFNRLAWEVTPPLVNFFGALLIFAAIDWRLAAGVAAVTTLTTSGMIVLGVRGGPLHRLHAQESGRVGGELIDVVANMWPVKAFSAGRRERERLVQAFQGEAAAHQRSWMFTEGVRAINDVALVVSAGVTLLFALALWTAHRVSAGDVVVISALTFRLLHGSRDLAFSLIGMGQSYAYVEETLEILGRPHQIADPPDARRLVRCGGSVRFERVSFGYRPETCVLDRVDLAIPAGQRVGLVGPSGAGKSTVLGLLLRLYDVQGGRIYVDGQDVTTLRQDDLRSAIATVPQEVSLFHRTLAENIRFARPDATDEEVRAAARAAFCDEFIDALPDGYDTLVGERGARLSGGQRQRIGVARAFLKDSPVVLLDEATSALDTRSELEVQAALDRLMQGRTVLAVAHRLSTLAGFDRIVVLQNGRVVEDGAPLELRRRRGVFDRLWRLQAEGLDVGLDDLAAA